jgi:hypothetical protein
MNAKETIKKYRTALFIVLIILLVWLFNEYNTKKQAGEFILGLGISGTLIAGIILVIGIILAMGDFMIFGGIAILLGLAGLISGGFYIALIKIISGINIPFYVWGLLILFLLIFILKKK